MYHNMIYHLSVQELRSSPALPRAYWSLVHLEQQWLSVWENVLENVAVPVSLENVIRRIRTVGRSGPPWVTHKSQKLSPSERNQYRPRRRGGPLASFFPPPHQAHSSFLGLIHALFFLHIGCYFRTRLVRGQNPIPNRPFRFCESEKKRVGYSLPCAALWCNRTMF